MKTRFLINIYKDEKDKWIARNVSTDIQVISNSKNKALEKIRLKFKQYLSTEAKSYLSEWKGNNEIVNCPFGKLLLPIDIWKCVFSGESCPTQAQVFLSQPEEFKNKCNADENKKDQILDLIIENRYDGFHHIPGRVKCVLCRRRKESFKHHYPWEINSLDQYIDLLNDDFRVKFLKSGLDLSAYAFGLCPVCFIDVINKLEHGMDGEFEYLTLDVYR
ncbi:MAG: hypothetical protein GY695_20050 [Aestuariibacter sp.]|nr:hypothetical protein [Aestuariibacter sp.]